MFRIVKSPRAWWPVSWTGIDEEGKPVENRIEMRFRLLKVDEYVELMREASTVQRAENETAPNDAEQKRTSVAFAEVVAKIAEDWRGVAAENGEPLAWTIENLSLLMNEPRLFDYTMDAFRAVTEGRAAIREGN